LSFLTVYRDIYNIAEGSYSHLMLHFKSFVLTGTLVSY